MKDLEPLPLSDKISGAPHPSEATTIFGQDSAQQQFLNAFDRGRLHHAWLLSGPRGVGKATLVWKIAKFLLTTPNAPAQDGLFGAMSQHVSNLETPSDHPALPRILAGSEPALCVLRRSYDEKRKRFKQNITVDDVRSLKSFFGLSAADGGARVVIIDAADDMTGSAANALLKMLEEPPKNAFLFLISHQPAALLPTLRSRCRELRLSALSHDMVQQALTQAKIHLSEEQSSLFTRLSAGSAGQAIRLAQLDGDALYSALISTLQTLPSLNQSAALKLAESFAGQANSERFDLLIDLIDYILGQAAKTSLIPLDPDSDPTTLDQKLFTTLHKGPIGARKWALLQQDISQRMRHGRAVNLDPVTLILDMFFKIEKCAAAL